MIMNFPYCTMYLSYTQCNLLRIKMPGKKWLALFSCFSFDDEKLLCTTYVFMQPCVQILWIERSGKLLYWMNNKLCYHHFKVFFFSFNTMRFHFPLLWWTSRLENGDRHFFELLYQMIDCVIIISMRKVFYFQFNAADNEINFPPFELTLHSLEHSRSIPDYRLHLCYNKSFNSC